MTSEEKAKAAAIVGEWFWQPDSWHRKSVVRYYESAPIQPDVLMLVIAYLKEEETQSLTLLGKVHPLGETWRATDAWFQTSPGDKWAGTESTKVRIYQAFKPKADESDGPYVVEDGCQYKVSHTFCWNVAELPELDESESGVQFTMQGVTRDATTGLFSCVIEKRERVQQDISLYDSRKTIFETQQKESHVGVKASDLATTGQAASAADGVSVTREVTKNPDCTSNVENVVTTEEPVDDANVKVRATLRGIWTQRVDRNQTPDAVETDPSADVGETIEREKTPGNLRNITKTTFESAAADSDVDLSQEHALTALEHADVRQKILKDGTSAAVEPSSLLIEKVTSVENPLPTGHGFSATGDQAGGPGRKLVRKRIVFNEETGQKELQQTERTSIPYKKNLSWTDGNAVHAMLVFRNQETVPDLATFASGKTDVSVSVSINDFGLFDGIYHARTYSRGGSSSGDTGINTSKTITIKERYVRPGGRTYVRTYTVTKYYWHADASGAANHYLTGVEYPNLGLRSRLTIYGQRGTAEWYGSDLTLVSDAPESGGAS